MRKQLLAAAVAAIAFSSLRASFERQRQLRRGEIRRLGAFWSRVNGVRTFARTSTVSRSGTPIVLVHGFGISSSYFVPLAERLATRFEVYAPDLPGHGRSGTPREPLDIPQLADALIAWMNAAGLSRAVWIGNSMGCQILADAAMRYPDRVDKLVLIGPTTDPAARTVVQQFMRLVMSSFHEKLSLVPLVAKDYLRMHLRLIDELRFMLEDRVEEKLTHVIAPTLLMRGEKDAIVPARWFTHVAELTAARRAVAFPQWGHAVHYSAAAATEKAIVAFLDESQVSGC